MAKGMRIPVGTNKKGGSRLLSGTPYTEQVVRVGLTPNTSRNPFQAGQGIEVGISEQIVFAVNDAAARARARREIIRFFRRLRQAELAKLQSGSEGLQLDADGDELVARIKYVDLDADQEREVESNLRDALLPSPRLNTSGQ